MNSLDDRCHLTIPYKVSMPPYTSLTCPSFVTSQTKVETVQFPHSFTISFFASDNEDALRSSMHTLASAPAKTFAMARPMPEAAPVMMAVLFFREKGMS